MPRCLLCCWKPCTAFILFFLASSWAYADPLPSVDLRRFSPSTDPGATLYLEPTATPGPGNFNAAEWVSWAYRPLVARAPNGQMLGDVVKHQVSLDTAAAIGLGQRSAVGLLVPVVIAQNSDTTAATQVLLGGASVPHQAIGDVALTGKVSVIPMGELGGFGLAALAKVTLPTGSRASTLGEGALTSELRALAEMRLIAISIQATAGFLLRTEERTFSDKTWGDEIPWGLGLVVRPQMFGWDSKGHWTWGVESHGWLPAGPHAPFTSASQTPTYAGVTARYAWRDISLLAGVETSLTRAAGGAPIRAVLQLGWTPRNHDRDNDGIDDNVDECPDLPEDRDGFEDSDGCPELDNDEDDIPDAEDACPNQPGPPSADPKKNGCPTG